MSQGTEATRRIEAQREDRMRTLKEHCRTLTGENRELMQSYYPELFTEDI